MFDIKFEDDRELFKIGDPKIAIAIKQTISSLFAEAQKAKRESMNQGNNYSYKSKLLASSASGGNPLAQSQKTGHGPQQPRLNYNNAAVKRQATGKGRMQ